MEGIKGYIVALEDQRAIFFTNHSGKLRYYLKIWNTKTVEGEEIYVTWRTKIDDIITEIQDTTFIPDREIDPEILDKVDEFLLLDAEVDETGNITLI
jgi:hypothetical protein